MEVALKYFDNGEMLAISGALVGELRPAFLSIPLLAPLLPLVQKAHDDLLHARVGEVDESNPDVAAIMEAQRGIDARHDHALRSLYFAHKALQHYLLSLDPPDYEGAADVEASSAGLLPEGLDMTRANYTAEEGNAARGKKLAETDETVGEVLGKLRVTAKVSGKDLVAHWASLGAEVGKKEREKSAAIAEAEAAAEAAGEEEDARSPLYAARNGWIGVVSTVLRVLGHATEPEAETIRRSVAEPAAKAAKRAATARKAAKERAAKEAVKAAEKAKAEAEKKGEGEKKKEPVA